LSLAFLAFKTPFITLQSGVSILACSVTLPASTLVQPPRHLAATLVKVLWAFGLARTAGHPLLMESCESPIVIASRVPPVIRVPLMTRKRPSGHGSGLGFLAGSEAAKARSARDARETRASRRSVMVSSARAYGRAVVRLRRRESYFPAQTAVKLS